MRYPDGTTIRVGDHVRLMNGEFGTVVLSIDTGEYSEDFREEDWEDVGSGIVVRTERGALVRFEEPNERDVILVSRNR